MWPAGACSPSARASAMRTSPIASRRTDPKPNLTGVVKNDAQRVPMAAANAAHAVAEIHAIDAACALHGALAHGEDHSIALFQRHDFRPRLHAGTLLRHHEFAAGEVVVRR